MYMNRAWLPGILVGMVAMLPAADAWRARAHNNQRLDRLAEDAWAGLVQASPICAGAAGEIERDGLAVWESIAGCGAGSSTGIGGIKWIGRNVSGGLVNVQCQV